MMPTQPILPQIGIFYCVNGEVVRVVALRKECIDVINDVTGQCQKLLSGDVLLTFTPAPPERPVSGREATCLLRAALAAHGLPRTSMLNGGENRGWLPKNYIGSDGFSIRKDPQDSSVLIWNLTLSGRPHLEYRNTTRNHGDHDEPDYCDDHEPTNPHVLYGKIKDAVASIGLVVSEIKMSSYQMHWDDDVSYQIKTNVPGWLLESN